MIYFFNTPAGRKTGVGPTVDEARENLRDTILKEENILLGLEEIEYISIVKGTYTCHIKM